MPIQLVILWVIGILPRGKWIIMDLYRFGDSHIEKSACQVKVPQSLYKVI